MLPRLSHFKEWVTHVLHIQPSLLSEDERRYLQQLAQDLDTVAKDPERLKIDPALRARVQLLSTNRHNR